MFSLKPGEKVSNLRGPLHSEDGSYITKTVSVPYAEPLRAELETFIGAIKNDTIPPITGEDGLRALEIALTALKLAHKGRDAS